MKWQELQQLEKLNLFDFVNKTELDMYINTLDINMFIKNYLQHTTKLYTRFLQIYDFQNKNMFEHLARLLCKYTKQVMWKRILESNRFTKKQNVYLDDVLTGYQEVKNKYVKYIELLELQPLEKDEVEVKKSKKSKKDDVTLLDTIFHSEITIPNIQNKTQSLLDYSMTEQSNMDLWLAERIGCITGSKLDSLLPCGISYNTAKSKDTALKYLMKLAREQKNKKPIEDNDDFTPYAAKRGIAREQLSRQEYEEQHNICVFEVGFFKSPIIEGLGCSLDGIVLNIDDNNNIIVDHIIEVKNFIDHLKLYRMLALEDFSDVFKQIQHNLLLTNAPKAVLILDTAVGNITNIQTFDFELDMYYMCEEFVPQLLWNKLQIEKIVEEIQHVKGL